MPATEIPTTRAVTLHYAKALLPHLDGNPDTLMLGTLTRRDLRTLHALLVNLMPHRTTGDNK